VGIGYHKLSEKHPETVKSLIALYEAWNEQEKSRRVASKAAANGNSLAMSIIVSIVLALTQMLGFLYFFLRYGMLKLP